MEVKPGYKQTEVGAIPEDWDASHLSKLCTLIVDGTHQTPRYVTSGVPFYSVENVVGNKFKNSKCISIEEHKKISKRALPQKGDILLTRIGSLGSTKLVDWDYESSIYVSLALLRFNKSIDSSYIYSYTKSRSFRMSIEERALMNAIPVKINMNMIGNIPIPIPNIIEQREIGRAITDIDLLINSLEKLIEKKKNIKQGVMQDLLTGKRRLQGFDKGWETKKLNSLCSCITTGRKDVNEGNPNGKYPFFTCSRSITFSDQYSFDSEAILIAGNGDVGTLHYYKGKFEAYQRTYVLSGFCIPAKYLVHYLNYSLIPALNENKIGSSIPYIKIGDLTDLLVNTPREQNEIRAIVDVLDDMDCEIGALSLQLEKCKNLKDGMMQELLTGRIRLL